MLLLNMIVLLAYSLYQMRQNEMQLTVRELRTSYRLGASRLAMPREAGFFPLKPPPHGARSTLMWVSVDYAIALEL